MTLAAEVTFSTTREEWLGEIDVSPRPPRRVGVVIGRILAAVGAVILLVFILGPLIWMAIAAFAERWKYPNMLPQSWTLSWWGKVLGGSDLMPALWLSLRFAILATLFSAIICLPAAYALGRSKFFGRRTILIGLFATNAFPRMGLFISMATLFYAMHLMSTRAGCDHRADAGHRGDDDLDPCGGVRLRLPQPD